MWAVLSRRASPSGSSCTSSEKVTGLCPMTREVSLGGARPVGRVRQDGVTRAVQRHATPYPSALRDWLHGAAQDVARVRGLTAEIAEDQVKLLVVGAQLPLTFEMHLEDGSHLLWQGNGALAILGLGSVEDELPAR